MHTVPGPATRLKGSVRRDPAEDPPPPVTSVAEAPHPPLSRIDNIAHLIGRRLLSDPGAPIAEDGDLDFMTTSTSSPSFCHHKTAILQEARHRRAAR
ncbi:hypothetical protein CDD83_7529 [Cordyceps sp. RAO-2017]|nr:hypothetical protein CDD83_7529 [Cordyceps sp. RAO-2017]